MSTDVATRTDEQILRDVLEELRWEPYVQHDAIQVTVKDGIVTLAGCVGHFIEKAAAAEAARSVRGVKAVIDNIEIRMAPSDQRADAEFAEAALRMLEWDAGIPPGSVQLVVAGGWVTLT